MAASVLFLGPTLGAERTLTDALTKQGKAFDFALATSALAKLEAHGPATVPPSEGSAEVLPGAEPTAVEASAAAETADAAGQVPDLPLFCICGDVPDWIEATGSELAPVSEVEAAAEAREQISQGSQSAIEASSECPGGRRIFLGSHGAVDVLVVSNGGDQAGGEAGDVVRFEAGGPQFRVKSRTRVAFVSGVYDRCSFGAGSPDERAEAAGLLPIETALEQMTASGGHVTGGVAVRVSPWTGDSVCVAVASRQGVHPAIAGSRPKPSFADGSSHTDAACVDVLLQLRLLAELDRRCGRPDPPVVLLMHQVPVYFDNKLFDNKEVNQAKRLAPAVLSPVTACLVEQIRPQYAVCGDDAGERKYVRAPFGPACTRLGVLGSLSQGGMAMGAWPVRVTSVQWRQEQARLGTAAAKQAEDIATEAAGLQSPFWLLDSLRAVSEWGSPTVPDEMNRVEKRPRGSFGNEAVRGGVCASTARGPTVHVGGLAVGTCEEEVLRRLSVCGRVVSVKVATDQHDRQGSGKGKGRGKSGGKGSRARATVAYVTFETQDDCDAAVARGPDMQLTIQHFLSFDENGKLQQQTLRRAYGGAGSSGAFQLANMEKHEDCWFCTTSTKGLEATGEHRILAMAKKLYVASAKGAVGEHHLVLSPMQHVANFACLAPDTQDELVRYLGCVRDMARLMGRRAVLWERWIPFRNLERQHLQLEVVQVRASAALCPSGADGEGAQRQQLLESTSYDGPGNEALQCLYRIVDEVFGEGARNRLVRLESMKEMVNAVPPPELSYFYIEIPSPEEAGSEAQTFVPSKAVLKGKSLKAGEEKHLPPVPPPLRFLFPSAKGEALPLDFGRRVACATMGAPDRVNWQDCVVSADEETKMTKSSRRFLRPFLMAELAAGAAAST